MTQTNPDPRKSLPSSQPGRRRSANPGDKFGRLTAIQAAGTRRGHTMWCFACECGTEKVLHLSKVVAGTTVSCGCYHRERLAARPLVNLAGVRFGRLVAIAWIPPARSGTKGRWRCECDCGNEHLVPSDHLRRRKEPVRSCGCIRAEILARNVGNPAAAARARHQAKRRLRIREDVFTGQDERQIFAAQRGRCAAPNCRARLTAYHRDHIQPLSKGGPHNRRNIQLLCPICNIRKNSQDPLQWTRKMGPLL